MATLIVNTGKAIFAGLVSGATAALPNHIGIGTGAGTTAATDTTLFTEETTGTWAGYARTANAGTRSTTTLTNDTANFSGTFTAPSAQAITNAGCFDAASAGNLCLKGDFATVNLATNDSLTVNISIQFN